VRSDNRARAVAELIGLGLTTASALGASVGDFAQFASARQFGAWLGLVPSQNSTSGKGSLGRITKPGDDYLRTLLIQGAKSAVMTAGKRSDRISQWLVQLNVLRTETGQPARFRLPEAVRWLASRALVERGEAAMVRSRLSDLLTSEALEAKRAFWWYPDRRWQRCYHHLGPDWQRVFDDACAQSRCEVVAAVGEALLHLDYLGGWRSGAARDRSLRAFALIPKAEPSVAARLWNVAAAWTAAPLPGLARLAASQARLKAWTDLDDPQQVVAS
jgi:hypothetical protein